MPGILKVCHEITSLLRVGHMTLSPRFQPGLEYRMKCRLLPVSVHMIASDRGSIKAREICWRKGHRRWWRSLLGRIFIYCDMASLVSPWNTSWCSCQHTERVWNSGTQLVL